MILAGDVGGTKVHLALYDFIDGKLKYTRDMQYPAKQYNGLEEIVKEFLSAEKVTAACFGVPGPVRDRGESGENIGRLQGNRRLLRRRHVRSERCRHVDEAIPWSP